MPWQDWVSVAFVFVLPTALLGGFAIRHRRVIRRIAWLNTDEGFISTLAPGDRYDSATGTVYPADPNQLPYRKPEVVQRP
jgi:hypothetical protein